MPLIKITAHVECEDCGKQIKLDLDPAQLCTTAFDAVEEAFGSGFEGASNYEGRMRCHACTSAYLDNWTAEHPHHISGLSRSGDDWIITTYADQKLRIRADDLPVVPEFDNDTRPLLRWAAAPELLEALKRLLNYEGHMAWCAHGNDMSRPCVCGLVEAHEVARAAIAKATGEPA